MQTEACLVLKQKRPHWCKRKAKSSSQFLSMFYLLEKEVIESNYEIAKKLFVEIFNSREAYIESVISARADMGSSLPGLHTLDPPLSPPSTLAKNFRRTCLQNHLQTSPSTPRSHIRSFGTVGQLSKIPPLSPQIYDSVYLKVFCQGFQLKLGNNP